MLKIKKSTKNKSGALIFMLGLFFAIFLFHSILFQARGSDDDLNKLEKKAEAYKKIIDLKKKQQIKIDEQNCYVSLLRDDEEKLIGFASLSAYLIPSKGYAGKIEDVIVDETHRGEGLGRNLMKALIEDAKKLNLIHLDLTSNPERIPARRLYESLGFQLRNTGVFRKEL